MTIGTLRDFLLAHPSAELHLMLPTGEFVPPHFHVTEVGRVQKDFIDCGGTRRSQVSCLLQVWVATDTDHRLAAGKLGNILQMAAPLLQSDDLPVEFEYEQDSVSQYPLSVADLTPAGMLLELARKHTDCLAKDRCGVGECGPDGDCTPAVTAPQSLESITA